MRVWRMIQGYRKHFCGAGSHLRAAYQRSYAVQAAGAPSFQVFNRRTKWLQKERAAANVEESRQADYLKDEVAVRLCERLLVAFSVPKILTSSAHLGDL